MDIGYVEQQRTRAEVLVRSLFEDEIKYDLNLNGEDLDQGFGKYDFGSLSQGLPRFSLNTAFLEAILDDGTLKKEEVGYAITDTLLSQYGLLLYELMEVSDTTLDEKVAKYLSKRFEGNDFSQYDIKNFFGEAFSKYARVKEGNAKYMDFVKDDWKLDSEFLEFFGILVHGLQVLVSSHIQANPELKAQSRVGIVFEMERNEDETTILIRKDGVRVGKSVVARVPSEEFIRYEISDYLEGGIVGDDERAGYQAMAEGLESAAEIHHLTYLEIEQDFRGEGFGSMLLSETMSFLRGDMLENDMVVVNASPMLGGGTLGLEGLVSFYEKFFKLDVMQSSNAMMSIRSKDDIKISKEPSKSSSRKNGLKGL